MAEERQLSFPTPAVPSLSVIVLMFNQVDVSRQCVEELHRGWDPNWDLHLVNNASTFYPTEMGEITPAHFDDLMGSNFKGPLFLSQAAWPALRAAGGAIVNIVDIHAKMPRRHYSVYCCAKAALRM